MIKLEKKQKNVLIVVVVLAIITTSIGFIQFTGFYLVNGGNGGGGTQYDSLPSEPELYNIYPSVDTDGSIDLSWSVSAYIWYYNVWRGYDIVPEHPGLFYYEEKVGRNIYTNSFVDNTEKENMEYCYRIEAVNNIGSVWSNYEYVIINVPPLPTPPSKPILYTIASPSYTGEIHISWSSVSDADDYKIYRSKDGTSYILLETVYSNSYDDTITENGEYSYKIKAGNEVGYSDYSDVKSVTVSISAPLPTAPDAPVLKDIYPQPNTDGNIRLEWDIVSDADRYTVYRSNNDVSYDLLEVVYVNYYDDSRTNGVYYYKLRAGNINDDYSDYSNVKSVTVQIPNVPDIPEAYYITYEVVDSGVEITVSWSSVSCVSYKLYREIINNTISTGFVLIKEGLTSTSYSEVLTEVGKYTYKVSAVNELGESDQSNPTSVNITDEGAEEPLDDDYIWLYVLLGVLCVAVVPVVILTRKKKKKSQMSLRMRL